MVYEVLQLYCVMELLVFLYDIYYDECKWNLENRFVIRL